MPRGRPRKRDSQTGRTEDLFSLDFDPLTLERSARASGYCRIAGLDEAGRGPLAGPVVAAAVVLPADLLITGVTDSKKLAEPERERLYELILKLALSWGVGIVDERTIDDVNIYQATIIAMERALECITPPPDYLLIDALTLPRVPIPQNPLIKGDLRSHSIAAASIVAKVTRDRLMKELHEKYPQYNFHKHKGYGTKEHLSLIRKHGPCEAHRKSFRPVSEMVKGACP
jgi:ribonuclease HII